MKQLMTTMEDQRFLFLFEYQQETYALMWDTEGKFVYLIRQSDGKATDGFNLPGYASHLEIKDYRHLVIFKCKSLLRQTGMFNFQ